MSQLEYTNSYLKLTLPHCDPLPILQQIHRNWLRGVHKTRQKS